MIPNIIVGLIFASIIVVAFRKVRSDMRDNKCSCGSSCSSGCAHKDICHKS